MPLKLPLSFREFKFQVNQDNGSKSGEAKDPICWILQLSDNKVVKMG